MLNSGKVCPVASILSLISIPNNSAVAAYSLLNLINSLLFPGTIISNAGSEDKLINSSLLVFSRLNLCQSDTETN